MSFRCLGLAAAAIATGSCGAGGHDHYTDGGTYNCDAEDRDEAYLAGMTKTGAKGVEFTLISSTPAPPGRGDNRWVVAIKTGGADATGAAVDAKAYMPDHRHFSPLDPVVTPAAEPGQYTIDPVNLWMPGLWEITVKATPLGAQMDQVVFRFCITG